MFGSVQLENALQHLLVAYLRLSDSRREHGMGDQFLPYAVCSASIWIIVFRSF